MFARVTTFQGSPDRIDEGVRIFREEMIPWLRDATGFRGWLVLLDRANDKSMGITFWKTEEAMRDSEASGGALREAVAASVGTVMQSMEFYEVVAADALALDELA